MTFNWSQVHSKHMVELRFVAFSYSTVSLQLATIFTIKIWITVYSFEFALANFGPTNIWDCFA